MKKTKDIKTNHGLIIIIAFILLFGAVIYLVANTNKTYDLKTNSTINTTDLNTYLSKEMKFSISVPAKFQVEDTGTKLTLSTDTRYINIIRNGTNYDNLSDYVVEFDVRRNLIASETKKLSIDGKEAISRLIEFPEENIKQKSYYIWTDYAVYILSTDSESLFPVLDQITQSFRYAP